MRFTPEAYRTVIDHLDNNKTLTWVDRLAKASFQFGVSAQDEVFFDDNVNEYTSFKS